MSGNFSMENLFNMLNELWPKLLFAVILVAVGLLLVKLLMKLIKKALLRGKLDPTYHSFFLSLIKITLYAVVAFIGLTTIGVPAASLVTIFGAVGLAISLAVKDSLANLAGGFLVLFSHPFGVGDYISLEGVEGTVKSINILYTRLNTSDNKGVYIPNGQVANATIINYSSEANRRLDMTFSISCHADFEKAKAIIEQAVAENPHALSQPAPLIRAGDQPVNALNALSIEVKVWVPKEQYGDLKYDLNEQVKARFDKEGIALPGAPAPYSVPKTQG